MERSFMGIYWRNYDVKQKMLQTFWHLKESGYSVQPSGAVPLPEFISGSIEWDVTGHSAGA